MNWAIWLEADFPINDWDFLCECNFADTDCKIGCRSFRKAFTSFIAAPGGSPAPPRSRRPASGERDVGWLMPSLLEGRGSLAQAHSSHASHHSYSGTAGVRASCARAG